MGLLKLVDLVEHPSCTSPSPLEILHTQTPGLTHLLTHLPSQLLGPLGSSASSTTTTGFARSKAKEEALEKEDKINWVLLEKVFLGDDWDKEIRELAVKVR